MNMDNSAMLVTLVLPLVILAMKLGIMWATWSLLSAATKFLRVLTKRMQK